MDGGFPLRHTVAALHVEPAAYMRPPRLTQQAGVVEESSQGEAGAHVPGSSVGPPLCSPYQ